MYHPNFHPNSWLGNFFVVHSEKPGPAVAATSQGYLRKKQFTAGKTLNHDSCLLCRQPAVEIQTLHARSVTLRRFLQSLCEGAQQ